MTKYQRRAFRPLRCAILSIVAFATVAFAQSSNTSELHGRVTDQTGGVVSGASVTLESADGTQRTIDTDREGRYAFKSVKPGAYTVTVARPGFMNVSNGVTLRPQVATSLDVGLKVAIAMSVDVKEGQGLSTDPRKNLSALVLTHREIAALPDDPQLLFLKVLEMAGSTGRPGDVAVYVNGFPDYKRLPPKDAIEIIRINSNVFSAEFSQPAAQRVEIVTKAGADSFHGDIGLQSRSSALEPSNPISDTKPDTRYYNYKGYLQGPLIKNRVGFFVSGGFWQQDDNAFVRATVLSPSTAAAQPFAATVSTPTEVGSGTAQLDFHVLNQIINVSYARTVESDRNLGLQSGFDLPEHAYNRSASDDTSRLWWTTVAGHVVNDLRVEITRGSRATTALVPTPAILVLGAFNAGGNQDAATTRSAFGFRGSEAMTLQQGSHTYKTGFEIGTTRQDNVDRAGFSGTFTFGTDVERDAAGRPVLDRAGEPIPISPIEHYRRTSLGLPGYLPSQYVIVRGNPQIDVEQRNIGWFVLDDWALSPHATVSYGVRQEVQDDLGLRPNLAPRASLSWLPDEAGRNAVKIGAGLFYQRVDPDITFETMKSDGVNRQQFIVEGPAFFPTAPTSFGPQPAQSIVYTKSDDLRAPLSFVTIASFERQLPGGLFGVAQYLFSKGTDLLRLRNIAAPLTGGSAPAVAPVLQFESTGRSLQHQLMFGLRYNSREVSAYANYRYGKKYSDTDGPFTVPADSHDLAAEYGWAADDQRHQLTAGATIQFDDDLLINPSITIASGRPFNITTGLDNNHDTLFNDRPGFAQAGEAGAINTSFGALNPNPQPGEPIVPRNFGREPLQMTVDVSATKTITRGVMISLDLQNLLNRANLFGTNGVLTSEVFGIPNQALSGRRVWLMVRYGF